MRHRRSVSFSLIAAAGLAFASNGLAQPVTLKLNLPAGKTFKFVGTNKMVTTGAGNMNAMGNMTQTMAMDIKVLGKTAQRQRVQMKVTDVKFQTPPNSPMAGQMSQAANSMKGLTIEQVYDARARALSTKVTGGAAAQQMLSQVGATRLGFLGVEFPAGPVAPGAKWSTTLDFGKIMGSAMPGMSAGPNSKLPVSFTYQGIRTQGGRRLANIAYTMVGNMDLNMGGGAPGGKTGGGGQMRISISMNMKGTFLVDLATGVPVSGTSNGTTSTTIGAQGMKIGQTINTSFTTK